MKRVNNQAGISTLEVAVALVILSIFFVGWLKLTAVAVRGTTYVQQLVDVGLLATSKGNELSKRAKSLVATLPPGQAQLGSMAPNTPVNGFFDLFSEQGKALCSTDATGKPICPSANTATFIRQWVLVADSPNPNDVSIYVTVHRKGRTEVMRQIKIVKSEAVLVK